MSAHTQELLQAFEALPAADRQAFVEVLRRTRDLPFDSGPITDEEIGEANRHMFAILAEHETASGTK